MLRNILTSLKIGSRTFLTELKETIKTFVYYTLRTITRIGLICIIIFGIGVLANLGKMGLSTDIVHTQSFSLLAISAVATFVSYIIMVAVA